MDRETLIAQTKRIIQDMHRNGPVDGKHAMASEYLRIYAGASSSFYAAIQKYDPLHYGDSYSQERISILESFLWYVEAGLHNDISPERQAQLDVVSDFLEMASQLLQTSGVHSAAPAVLIGATLEEFLRTWIESENLSLGSRKPGIETYSQVLREANLLTRQDGKDITSWAGMRNHAAHGEWEEVTDKQRVSLMLDGVNLFMRKYSI